MVRNGISTVVQGVLQVLSIHGLIAGMVGSDALLVARRRRRRRRRGSAHPLPTWCRSRERAQRARRQRIVIARVGGAGAAGHDWYIMRLNHVLTFEQQESMLAWGKQALIEHMHCRRVSGMLSFVGVSLLFGSVILLAFARRRAAAETGLARTYKAYC